MKANFYLTHNAPIHDRAITALYNGCPIQKELRDVRDYQPSDIAVVFGVYKRAVPFSRHRGEIIEGQKALKKKTVVLETGYLRRGDGENDYYAAGLNGLNGRADFRNFNMPSDRWDKLGISLIPWNPKEDGCVLLCAQVPWDASVDFTNHTMWLEDSVSRIRRWSSRPIVLRPHPKARQHVIGMSGIEISTGEIADDFARSWAVVTFNSNSGVEAAIAGIPVFVDDQGSMAYPVANRNLIYLNDPEMPDRTQWASDLAYAQWTLDEMRSGETWRHLLR